MKKFKTGDKVWCNNNGWGRVVYIDDMRMMLVRYESGYQRIYLEEEPEVQAFRKESECDESHQSFWFPWLW